MTHRPDTALGSPSATVVRPALDLTPPRRLAADEAPARVDSPAFGRYPDYTRQRLAAFTGRLAAQVYPRSVLPRVLQVAGPLGRISPADAVGLCYEDADRSTVYGPTWATFWFKLAFDVPADWAGRRADLHWSSNSEASCGGPTLTAGSRACRASTPASKSTRRGPRRRCWRRAAAGESIELYVEMACNRLLGFDDLPGRTRPPEDAPPFVLGGCELRLFDADAWSLLHDFDVLRALEADHNPPQVPRNVGGLGEAVRPALDRAWQGKLLRRLNEACNLIVPEDRATWPGGRRVLDELLAARNGTIAHDLAACGHAHIDTAWLWPLAETHRKCQRTFSSVLAYMERYPDFVFACPQAYQYPRDGARQSGALRADLPPHRRGPVDPGRRELGRARLQPARRRGDVPPVPLRGSSSSTTTSAGAATSSGTRTSSATTRSSPSSCATPA